MGYRAANYALPLCVEANFCYSSMIASEMRAEEASTIVNQENPSEPLPLPSWGLPQAMNIPNTAKKEKGKP